MIARTAATRANLIAAKEDYNAAYESYYTICDNTDDRRTIDEALNVLLAASRRLTRAAREAAKSKRIDEDAQAAYESYYTICNNTDDRRTIDEALNVLLAASRRLTRAEIADDEATEQANKS